MWNYQRVCSHIYQIGNVEHFFKDKVGSVRPGLRFFVSNWMCLQTGGESPKQPFQQGKLYYCISGSIFIIYFDRENYHNEIGSVNLVVGSSGNYHFFADTHA